MSEETDYTKVIDLIHKKQFEAAGIEVERLRRNAPELIQLTLLSIYCKITCNKYRAATITVSKALKSFPDHQLLQETKAYLNAVKSAKNMKNPLAEFVSALTAYTYSNIPTDRNKFDLLMNQLLIKPYLK